MKWLTLAVLATILFGIGLVVWLGLRSDPRAGAAGEVPQLGAAQADPIARGSYLARAGNCGGCHTERGGQKYAGGRAIPTAFGEFRAPNLTPDAETGLGRWSEADFWRAMHEGRRPDGSPLYPSFPYPEYTRLSRADVDALWAYLKSLPAVHAANRAHALSFPYSIRPLLVVWRALYFRPGTFRSDPAHDEAWNRGAYLVQGFGHCEVCHEERGVLGGSSDGREARGGVALGWYAPSLASPREAGVQDWSEARTAEFFRTGVSGNAAAVGPMAEVIYDSLQYLVDRDLQSMAHYLRAIPERPPPAATESLSVAAVRVERGGRAYAKHCADCHGDAGQGALPAAPPLAGNRAVTMASSQDAIRVTLFGGYPPGTRGDPQPFGMPPYASALGNGEIADVLTYVRGSWGNHASPVYDFEVARQRGDPLW